MKTVLKITAGLGLAIAALCLWIVVARFYHERNAWRHAGGSISYDCEDGVPAGRNFKADGPFDFRLTEARHPKRLGDWTVTWPGQQPIRAQSFNARTGSYGGSQGIRWQEADGRYMTAIMSFSDMVTEYGTSVIWGEIVQSAAPGSAIRFTCSPDLASWHE